MQTKYIDTLQYFGKDAMQAAKELETINTNAFKKFVEQQFASFNVYADAGVRQMKLMSEAKAYPDLVAGHVQIVSETVDKVLDNARKSVDIVNDVREEYSTWFENKAKTAESRLNPKTPVKKAA